MYGKFSDTVNNFSKKTKDTVKKPPLQLSTEQLNIRHNFIKDKIDLVKIILLILGEIPLVGWIFDISLFFYSILKKDFALALVTFFGLLLFIFGLKPVLKLFYVFDKMQKIKKYQIILKIF